jgi:multidrug efflux pump subunit AcrA (membrane-fusion protein)
MDSQPNNLSSVSPQGEEKQAQLRGGRKILVNSSVNSSSIVQPQQYSLPLVQENDFFPQISRWTNLGGLFIAGAVGIIFGLSSVINYKVTIKAQAVIRPSGELRLVQSPTPGSVISIAVQENQFVQTGDIIAILDDSQLQTQKNQLKSNIGQAQLQLLQLNAQIRTVDSQIQAESDRNQRAINSAQIELSHSQREYRDRTMTTSAEVQEAQANFKQSQQELYKAQKELKSIEASLKSTKVSLRVANSKWQRYQQIAQEGALSQNQLEEAQLAVEQQKQELARQKATMAAHQEFIEQQKQAVESARARWQKSKVGLNPSQAEVAIASERIAQEKASGDATLANLAQEKETLIQQQIEISKQLERDTSQLQQIELDLQKTTITATADGIITNLNLRNSGQTVHSGENIAQIVPTDVPLQIKATVSPQYIGQLAEGQNVQMRVSACPYTDYGTLKGVVTQISEDTIKPQANNNSLIANQEGDLTSSFYEVTIQPQNLSLVSGKNHCDIQLGMEGRADIISREETILKFLLRKVKLLTDI